ncbi:MAG: ABC transporter permease [Acidimicrobiia bacterium]|nr:ABC transporter permease [Acidimicrobiia bacterium]
MTATAETHTMRSPLVRTLRDIGVITKRNVLRNVRLPQLLLFATIQPVMFLLLFNYVFGGSIGQSPQLAQFGGYINWLIPGIIMQSAVFGSSQTAIGLTEDLQAGVIDRFRSLPMARSAVLAGRTISDLLRNAFVSGLMLTVGALIGFRYQTSFAQLVLGFLLAMGFGFSFSWVMASVGLAVKDTETAQVAGFIPLFPLVFASSVFVSVESLPSWLRVFADHQPITVLANAIRGLFLGEAALPAGTTVSGTVLAALGWTLGILLVFFPLSVRLYRRAAG